MDDTQMTDSGSMGGEGGTQMSGGSMGGEQSTQGQRMISRRELKQMFDQRGGANISPQMRQALQGLIDAAEADPKARQDDEGTRAKGSSTFIYDCFVYTCQWEE